MEAPVEDIFGRSDEELGLYVALLDVSVLPGVTALIDTTGSPWVYGEGTPELEARYVHGCRTSLKMCREMADNSTETAGVFRGAGGAKILSIRLSDVCRHDEGAWTRKACGHTWCDRCAGYVDPTNRVALSSPGPIITCNRMPRPRKDY